MTPVLGAGPPPEVWAECPPEYRPLPGGVTPVGGGLSGAQVWKVVAPAGEFALKLHPFGDVAQVGRLLAQHRLLAALHGLGLTVFPQPVPFGVGGGTLAPMFARFAELLTWRPGSPADAIRPEVAPVLAVLHSAAPVEDYSDLSRNDGDCVARREVEFQRARTNGSLPPGWEGTLRDHLAALAADRPALGAPAVCWRDARRENVLFTNGVLTGVIDAGAAAVDRPAVDLARYLGSVAPLDFGAWPGFVAAWSAAGGRAADPLATARACWRLHVVGTVLALARWEFWLAAGLPPGKKAAAEARRQELLAVVDGLSARRSPPL